MLQTQKIEIDKTQLWKNFIQLKKWLTTYWHFLENLPLEVFTDEAQVVDYLREQQQKLAVTQTKFHMMEMIGAVLKLSLDRMTSHTLSFEISDDLLAPPPPDYKEITDFSKKLKLMEDSLQKLVNQVNYLAKYLPGESKEQLSPILQAIGSLFKAIIRQDSHDVNLEIKQINSLTTSKQSEVLVEEIGKMTREIYNSLQDLSSNLDTEELRHATDEMPDAVQKLYTVIQRLEDATNDNLDFLEGLLQRCEENIELIESILTDCDQMKEQLANLSDDNPGLEDKLKPIQITLEEQLRTKLNQLLEALYNDQNSFITIMTNQGFQDLTGQTLKKIIDFMEQLQLRLLELLQKYSDQLGAAQEKKQKQTDFLTKVDVGSEGEEIQLHGPDETEAQKSTQANVDSLLAELGF